jgi:hypothetical protein
MSHGMEAGICIYIDICYSSKSWWLMIIFMEVQWCIYIYTDNADLLMTTIICHDFNGYLWMSLLMLHTGYIGMILVDHGI